MSRQKHEKIEFEEVVRELERELDGRQEAELFKLIEQNGAQIEKQYA